MVHKKKQNREENSSARRKGNKEKVEYAVMEGRKNVRFRQRR